MNSNKTRIPLFNGIMLVLVGVSIASCTKIPAEGSIAPDISYKNRKQYAISGLEQNIGNFQASTSTLPLTFEIINVRETNNQDVNALNEQVPVVRYTEPITGNETEAELQLKTDTVELPAVSINEHTGQVEILEGNKIPAGEYHFDIKVSNLSGSKVLEDALVIEFKEYEVTSWSSSGMAKSPEIERVADSPNQILFVGYQEGVPLRGDQIDFTRDRSHGFKGTFVNDTNEGEIWSVNFPVKQSDTYCTWQIVKEVDGLKVISYESANFNFVLGLPGSYVIRLYK